jgi:hypothetical protein
VNRDYLRLTVRTETVESVKLLDDSFLHWIFGNGKPQLGMLPINSLASSRKPTFSG